MVIIRIQTLSGTKVSRRPILVLRCKRVSRNRFYEGKQMTAIQAGAPSTYAKNWNLVNWKKVRAIVYRMQTRIAKSIREGKWGKAKALQYILARSFCGKLLAVNRITSNKGSRTPGLDGVTWNSPSHRWQAALNLKVSGYQSQALRRIYIPKKNGKKRPLGISTLTTGPCRNYSHLGSGPSQKP
jgi:RNA-directed DNA polymerase